MDHQDDVGGVVRLVRPLLHSYGVRLPNQVRVELVAPGELRTGAGDSLHGLTLLQEWSDGLRRVGAIKVVSGLPATQFGQVVAHEMGHAWLAACPGHKSRSLVDEEGICELVGSWWLRHRRGPLAEHYLDQLVTCPDPIYGDGYRRAAGRAGGLSPAEVVRRVALTGQI